MGRRGVIVVLLLSVCHDCLEVSVSSAKILISAYFRAKVDNISVNNPMLRRGIL